MGKAYSEEQREKVRQLLESGKDEDAIEKETGVSDRTVRRWKLELERSKSALAHTTTAKPIARSATWLTPAHQLVA